MTVLEKDYLNYLHYIQMGHHGHAHEGPVLTFEEYCAAEDENSRAIRLNRERAAELQEEFLRTIAATSSAPAGRVG